MAKTLKKQPTMKSFERSELHYAATLMLAKRWEEAYETLLPILAKHPYDIKTLQMLNDVSFDVEDYVIAWITSYRLMDLLPNEAIGFMNAAIAASYLDLPFTVVHYADIYLQRWGNEPDAKDIRELKKIWEEICEANRKHDPVNTARPNAELSLLEQGQFLTIIGDLEEAREICHKTIELMPDVAAPYNNLSLSYVIEGNLAEALRIAQEAIKRFPDNFHARCNLVQLLVRVGRKSEAENLAVTLAQDVPQVSNSWEKLIETFTYLCDDEKIIQLYHQSQKIPNLSFMPMIRHAIAVAFARTGDRKTAEKMWKALLKEDPDMDIVQDNLDDLKQRPGERHGPWAFSDAQWFPPAWIDKIIDLLRNIQNEQTTKRKIERMLRETLGMETALQMMLERGAPDGRALAIQICTIFPLSGLVEFVQGQNGTDEDRIIASEAAVNHGLLPRGVPVKMFREGKQTELLFLNYEIHGEPDRRQFPKPIQRLYQQSVDAVHNGDFEQASQLAQAAFALLPNDPVIMNQVAVTLIQLGKNKEGEAVLRQNAEINPDYLFARCGMANLCIREGKLKEAKEWLAPIIKRARFHLSEFNMLAHTQAQLLNAEGNKDAARQWLDLLESAINEAEPQPEIKRKRWMR